MVTGKILVVEDEVFIAHDIRKVLEAEGYEVLIDCFSVDIAIQAVENQQPDLVLVDINLGQKKNGIDLADYLERIARIPYVFITSYSDRTTLMKVSAHSPAGYITKPFKPQDLISTVFLAISRIHPVKSPKNEESAVPFALTLVLDYIEKNIREKMDVDTLAQLTQWEAEHFGRIFKEHVGLTPYQYVLKSKIERSKELLIQTDQSSQSIAFELGFSNYSNFFNAFRKHANMTPEHYRKLMRDNSNG